MSANWNSLFADVGMPASALNGTAIRITGNDPVLPTRFALAETAASVLAAVGGMAAILWQSRGGASQRIDVDVQRTAAALNSFRYHRIVGGMDPAESFAARDNGSTAIYKTRDGRFFHTHGSFNPDDMVSALGVTDQTPAKIAAAVIQRNGLELEDEMAERGFCGAMIRSAQQWGEHPHGQALADSPLVEIIKIGDSPIEPLPPIALAAKAKTRPLSDIRVMDLTRVLAGPTCARTMAEHGADVLRISSAGVPTFDFFDMDTGHGKRSAYLDLKKREEHAILSELLSGADIFSEGYRPGVMDRLGFGPDACHATRPGIVCVSINCYGYRGPFASRPGWEQLGQSVSGMAFEEGAPDAPRLVPAAACDYTTGYLAAFGALVALHRRATEGGSYHVRVSLARTGMWYLDQDRVGADVVLPGELTREKARPWTVETQTPWGRMAHLAPVVQMSQTPPRWRLPSPKTGADVPQWLPAA